METIIVKHRVEFKSQGTYYFVPFEVPTDVEKIIVSYQYTKCSLYNKEKLYNIIDFGLEDSSGQFIGWSGSSQKKVYVGEFESTYGYLVGPIKAGKWKILVGAYQINSYGVDISYKITFERHKMRWYYGDLHMHSNASDGKYNIYELVRKASKRKLDFIAITNHNNYAENLRLPRLPGVTIIPGVEWTHYKGHMNFFGVKNPFKNSFIANNEEEMISIIKHAKNLGAIISVNHPMCNSCPYKWENNTVFDIIEIWNGPMQKSNLKTIEWWTELLMEGRKIPIVGGSDYHGTHKRLMGYPVTALNARSRNISDLLYSMKNGHGYVTEFVNGVHLEIDCNGSSFGDTIILNRPLEINFVAYNLPKYTQLLVVTELGVIYSQTNRLKSFVKGRTLKKTLGFAYLKVVRHRGSKEYVLAISNPIYFKSAEL